ncbi:MAG: glutamate racemase, partial [Chloroflexi bacterium]|nr:glutamate racemase [Chloroflexota bacterium]
MASSDPIGVFDSGVGGLAIAAEIRTLLPAEHLLYYADHAHFPYGNKSPQELRVCVAAVAERLVDQGAKIIVVACNTASSLALAELRARFRVPFVGIVPAVKPAAQSTRTGKVGVLATEATFRTRVFADLVTEYAGGVTLVNRACPDLVAAVEAGDVGAGWLPDRVRAHLTPVLAQGIDTLVLGCTHYSFLRSHIEAVTGPFVNIIDGAEPVARQVERVLDRDGLRNTSGGSGSIRYLTSGDMD